MRKQFLQQRAAKMGRGKGEHGGTSFTKSPSFVIRDIEEEALDISGWSYILSRNVAWNIHPMPFVARCIVRILHVQAYVVWFTCRLLRKVL